MKIKFNMKKNSKIKQTLIHNRERLLFLLISGMLFIVMTHISTYTLVASLSFESYSCMEELGENDTPLTYLSSGTSIYQRGINYYVEKGTKRIQDSYPIYVKHGTGLYLLATEGWLVNESFQEVLYEQGNYLTEGSLFDKQMKQVTTDKILFLGLENGSVMNGEPFELLSGKQTIEIPMNSVLIFGEDQFEYYTYEDGMLRYHNINQLDDSTLLAFPSVTYAYDTVLKKTNALHSDTSYDISNATYSLDNDSYQYYLSVRYDFDESASLIDTKEGYVLENDGQYYVANQAPIYTKDKKKLVLPWDYVLVEPYYSVMNRAPALTTIESGPSGIYVTIEDQTSLYQNFFLFSGEDTYIFFDTTTITYGKKKIKIPAFSSVTIYEHQFEVYNQKKNTVKIYDMSDVAVTAKMKNGNLINLTNKSFVNNNGTEVLIVTNPEVLNTPGQGE